MPAGRLLGLRPGVTSGSLELGRLYRPTRADDEWALVERAGRCALQLANKPARRCDLVGARPVGKLALGANGRLAGAYYYFRPGYYCYRSVFGLIRVSWADIQHVVVPDGRPALLLSLSASQPRGAELMDGDQQLGRAHLSRPCNEICSHCSDLPGRMWLLQLPAASELGPVMRWALYACSLAKLDRLTWLVAVVLPRVNIKYLRFHAEHRMPERRRARERYCEQLIGQLDLGQRQLASWPDSRLASLHVVELLATSSLMDNSCNLAS